MKKLNKHGLTINNLKAASGATGGSSQLHTTITYDRETGDLYTFDLVGENYIRIDDDSILFIADTYRHLTMQEIADRVHDAVTACSC